MREAQSSGGVKVVGKGPRLTVSAGRSVDEVASVVIVGRESRI